METIYYIGLYRGYIGIMEKEMETTCLTSVPIRGTFLRYLELFGGCVIRFLRRVGKCMYWVSLFRGP